MTKPWAKSSHFPAAVPKPTPSARRHLNEIRSLLERPIDALPEPFREVFVLREVEGLSVEETAHVLSLHAATVKTRLHRARMRLRRALQDQLAPALKAPSRSRASGADGSRAPCFAGSASAQPLDPARHHGRMADPHVSAVGAAVYEIRGKRGSRASNVPSRVSMGAGFIICGAVGSAPLTAV